MRRIVQLLAALMLVTACDDEVFTPVPSELVVEGWIESNGYPVVLLSRTLPLSTERQEADLLEYMVRGARVAVTDGRDTVLLTGQVDRSYFPPYIYTTTRMRGKVGRSYQLIVDYQDLHATAETRIPAAPTVDSLRVQPCSGSDSLYQIKLYFQDPVEEKNYYQTFVRVGRAQKQFLSAFMGCIDDNLLEGASMLPVYRGFHRNDSLYTPYFGGKDTVVVKFCQVDAFGFDFWREYNNSHSSSGNALVSTSTNLPSNVTGGTGCWIGYGLKQQVLYMEREINMKK